MALRGTLVLDFTKWDQALAHASQNLKTFADTGAGVQQRLQRTFNQFDGRKVISEAKLMATAIEQIGGAAKLTDTEMRRVNATMNEAIAKYRALGTATKDIPANIRAVAEATAQAGRQSSLFGSAIANVTRYAMVYAGPLAIGAALKRTVEWGDELADLSQKTGISTTNLQRLSYAAERSGSSLEQMTRATQMMADRLGGDDKSAAAAVEKLGLNFQQLKNQDPGETFLSLGRAIGALKDPYQQATLATDLFGKSGKELIGVFKELARTGTEDIPTMSEAAVKGLGDLSDALVDVKNAAKALAGEYVGTFGPSITWAIRQATDLTRALREQMQSMREMEQFGLRGALSRRLGRELALPTPPPAPNLAGAPPSLETAGWRMMGPLLAEATLAPKEAAKARAALVAGYNSALLYGIVIRATFDAALVEAANLKDLPILRDLGLAGGPTVAPNIRPQMPAIGAGFWQTAFGGGQGFTTGLTSTLMSALTGGGSVSKSLGGFVGGGLGQWAGQAFKGAASLLGGGAGQLFGALSTAIPVVGAFIGPIIGGLLGKLFGGGQAAQTAKMRQEWIAQAGGLAEIRKQADYAGFSLDKLLSTKKTKTFEAEVKRLEAAFKATQERVQALVTDLQKLGTSGALITGDLIKRLGADKSKAEVQQALGEFLTQQTDKGLAALQGIAEGAAPLTTGAGSALAGAAAAFFQQLRELGATTYEALTKLAPTIEGLAAKLGKLGIGGGAAFDRLVRFSRLASDQFAGPLVSSVDQVGQLLTALANTGWLDAEMFAGLASQAGMAFAKLVEGGTAADDAMLLLQPTLQRIWELEQQFGWSVDESTQALIDQAREAGLIGEAFKSPMDKMIGAIDKLIERLDVFLSKILGIPSAADDAANGMNDAFGRVQGPNFGGAVEDPFAGAPSFASGTGGFRDFGTGTAAILHGSEAVVTEGQWRALAGPSVTFNIQALDPRGVREVIEQQIAPYLADVYSGNFSGLRSRTRVALGVTG